MSTSPTTTTLPRPFHLLLAAATLTLGACASPHTRTAASAAPNPLPKNQPVPREHLIPYTDLMVFPDNWPEITRQRSGGVTTSESATNLATIAKLNQVVPEFIVKQARLDAAINQFSQATGTHAFVNWPALQRLGIGRDTPVTLSLREIPAHFMLTLLLDQAAQAHGTLDFMIEESLVSISSKEDLQSTKYQTIKVFDIRDLLTSPTYGGNLGSPAPATDEQKKIRTELIDSLINVIHANVAPTSWRDAGGTIGSIRELNGQLIVNQTVENQYAIYNLLNELRAAKHLPTKSGDLFGPGYDHPASVPAAPDTTPAVAPKTKSAAASEIRKQKVATLIADAGKLYAAQQFAEARDLLRQATIIDPQDENAALLYRLVSTKIIDRDREAIQHRNSTEWIIQHVDTDER